MKKKLAITVNQNLAKLYIPVRKSERVWSSASPIPMRFKIGTKYDVTLVFSQPWKSRQMAFCTLPIGARQLGKRIGEEDLLHPTNVRLNGKSFLDDRFHAGPR